MSDDKKQTWTQLSKDVGFPARTMREWRKLPGAPTVPDLDQWKVFIDENDLGIAGNRVSKDREYWLIEKLKKEVKLQDIRIEKESRKLVDIDEVSAFVANLLLGVKQTVYHGFRELPRQVIGDELVDAQIKSEAYADRIMLDLQGQVKAWWPDDTEVPNADEDDS